MSIRIQVRCDGLNQVHLGSSSYRISGCILWARRYESAQSPNPHGIEAVREIAAAGFVVDRSSGTTDPGQGCSSRAGGQLIDESSFSI